MIGLMDIAPVNPGHLMVVPRRHAPSLADLDEETGAHVFVVAMRLAAALRAAAAPAPLRGVAGFAGDPAPVRVRCEGVNLFLADGEAAFQDVFHVHLHVLPRWRGDSFRVDADWSARPERAELDAVAGAIRFAHERLSA